MRILLRTNFPTVGLRKGSVEYIDRGDWRFNTHNGSMTIMYRSFDVTLQANQYQIVGYSEGDRTFRTLAEEGARNQAERRLFGTYLDDQGNQHKVAEEVDGNVRFSRANMSLFRVPGSSLMRCIEALLDECHSSEEARYALQQMARAHREHCFNKEKTIPNWWEAVRAVRRSVIEGLHYFEFDRMRTADASRVQRLLEDTNVPSEVIDEEWFQAAQRGVRENVPDPPKKELPKRKFNKRRAIDL